MRRFLKHVINVHLFVRGKYEVIVFLLIGLICLSFLVWLLYFSTIIPNGTIILVKWISSWFTAFVVFVIREFFLEFLWVFQLMRAVISNSKSLWSLWFLKIYGELFIQYAFGVNWSTLIIVCFISTIARYSISFWVLINATFPVWLRFGSPSLTTHWEKTLDPSWVQLLLMLLPGIYAHIGSGTHLSLWRLIGDLIKEVNVLDFYDLPSRSSCQSSLALCSHSALADVLSVSIFCGTIRAVSYWRELHLLSHRLRRHFLLKVGHDVNRSNNSRLRFGASFGRCLLFLATLASLAW